MLERRALADGRRHDAPYGVERSEQLDLEITVGEMVRLGDHHLEADAHVFVAHLLRAGQEASVAAQIRNVLQERFADVGHASSCSGSAQPRRLPHRRLGVATFCGNSLTIWTLT